MICPNTRTLFLIKIWKIIYFYGCVRENYQVWYNKCLACFCMTPINMPTSLWKKQTNLRQMCIGKYLRNDIFICRAQQRSAIFWRQTAINFWRMGIRWLLRFDFICISNKNWNHKRHYYRNIPALTTICIHRARRACLQRWTWVSAAFYDVIHHRKIEDLFILLCRW